MIQRSATKSLRRQLSLALTGLILVLGVTSLVGAWFLLGEFQRRVIETDIRDSVEQLLAAVQKGETGVYLDTGRLGRAYKQPLSGEYFVITGKTWRWRSQSLWDEQLPLQHDRQLGQFFTLPGPSDQQLKALSEAYRRHGQNFVITVAKDFRPFQLALTQTLLIFAGAWVVGLIIALFYINHQIMRKLQPLEDARSQVSDIHAGDRTAMDLHAPAELSPLIDEINRLMVETRSALLRSRKSLGNLGHALKTPLSVLFVLIERPEIRRNAEIYASFKEQLNLISNRIQRELAIDKSSPSLLEQFIPEKDLPPLLGALKKAHQREMTVNLSIQPEARLPYDRSDMIEILGNLLDNAYKWATSRIDVDIHKVGNHWQISVSDDGPGIPDTSTSELAIQRGQRLDESVAGEGLGLAIVADIVEAYGGKLVLGTGTLGGLEVGISF